MQVGGGFAVLKYENKPEIYRQPDDNWAMTGWRGPVEGTNGALRVRPCARILCLSIHPAHLPALHVLQASVDSLALAFKSHLAPKGRSWIAELLSGQLEGMDQWRSAS